MAIIRATKNGNWSDPTVWAPSVPTAADDVYSNTFTVTIDVSVTVLSIRNTSTTGVTAGGGFTATAGTTITASGAGFVSGTAVLVTSNIASSQTLALVGQLIGGSGSGSASLQHTGMGTVNVTGSCTGGNNGGGSPSYALLNTGGGVVNITGSATGTGANGVAVANSGNGTINLTGDATGGSSVSIANYGVHNISGGTINVTGTVTGGSGTPTLSAGAANTGVGLLTVTGTCQAGSAAPAVYSTSATGVAILTGPFLTTANGINPVYAARWFWQNTTPPATRYEIRSANLAVIRPLYTADSVGGNPATANVRSGTIYGPSNELTGTLAVPPADSVALGVPVDATTGTAAITAASIRSAMGLASANLDTQLAAIPTTPAPSAAAIATAVNTALDRTGFSLTNAERQAIATAVEQSILNENDGQAILNAIVGAIGNQNVDQIALVAAIRADLERTGGTLATRSTLTAGEVRAELDTNSTKLANLDATVSSRLAASGYTVPPSAAAIAAAVWSAATRTLTTAIDNSATIAAAVWSAVTRTVTGGTVDTLTNAPDVPTEGEIADAVRIELTPELARMANAATTQEVGDIVEGAMQLPEEP